MIFRALGLCNVSGHVVYYLVLKFQSTIIEKRHHMMVVEHYRDINAQKGMDAEGILIV